MLSDDRLQELGLTTIDEITTLRTACAEAMDVKGGPGQLQIKMNMYIIDVIRDAKLTWKEISEALLICRTTLWRRKKECGTSIKCHMDISDFDLDTFLRSLNNRFPHSGLSIIRGYLESLGLHVQKRRIIEALHQIDPLRSQRWHTNIHRTPYCVPGPNSLLWPHRWPS